MSALVETVTRLVVQQLLEGEQLDFLGGRDRYGRRGEHQVGSRNGYERASPASRTTWIGARAVGRRGAGLPANRQRTPTHCRPMAPLTPARFLTAWSPDALLLLPIALAAAYLLVLRAAHRRTVRWPAWRTTVFLAAALVLAWSANGAPAAYRRSLNWMGTLSVGLTTAAVPLGLALGDPLGLYERVRGRQLQWLRGRAAQVLMFPVVASVVAAVVVTLVFTTGWYAAARTDARSWALLQVLVLLVGVLVNLPLLSEDLLPAWCTPGVRTLLAFADGVADAVPGIVVMTSIDWVAGGALLSAAEAVGVPTIFAVMVQWMRADEAEARETDARLDRLDAVRTVRAAAAAQTPQVAGATGDPVEDARELDRPWWESDPQLAHRFRRPPAAD